MTGRDTILIWLAAGAFVLSILAANAHLAYVAITSHPGCVVQAADAAAATPTC